MRAEAFASARVVYFLVSLNRPLVADKVRDHGRHARVEADYSSMPRSFGSARTRTDDYEFTKLVLWLAEAQRQNGVHGRNRTCDLHLRTVAL